ncbi:molybdopterin-guanine dinucleotide biosynthesis protein B [Haloquadratum walsbyi]|jgi:molybdopterin-guanine dinucleotide biosynthesis protein MobB|uniref:Molybdopterin-guanine dinucleotide biosynthesis protein MobB n=1 Tax=Haloquadratum walsbyi J07HQW2 TaxID=1238425 RepID=U1NE41_9EURY|nr:molybdopterin-guanine dinucleotide biosynthesis protein B [Haloquadratum walsbyi]ERG95270.1 MAG: molybdopterin-guanine dinucleotide biosynthesis protein MobB [Haloquadratum walsbyi J07HQW2]
MSTLPTNTEIQPLCIVGPSDSGKTTFLESLIGHLSVVGQVGTIKSIHHDIEPDTPGKDTYRHRQAGAETVVGVTPSLSFQISTSGKADTEDEADMLDTVVSDLKTSGYQFILIEGFDSSSYPKYVLTDSNETDRSTYDIAPPVVGRASLDETNSKAVASAIIDGTLFR